MSKITSGMLHFLLSDVQFISLKKFFLVNQMSIHCFHILQALSSWPSFIMEVYTVELCSFACAEMGKNFTMFILEKHIPTM